MFDTLYGQISKISYVKYVDSLTYIKPLAMKEIVIQGEASEQFRELISQSGKKLNDIFVYGYKTDGVNREVGEKENSKLNKDKMKYNLSFSIDTSSFYENYLSTFKIVSPRRICFIHGRCPTFLQLSLNQDCNKVTEYRLFPENMIGKMIIENIEKFLDSYGDELEPDDTEEKF